MERILVAVDLSEPSRQALQAALELARAFEAPLRVVHVITPVSSPVGWIDYVTALETESTKLFNEMIEAQLQAQAKPRPAVERWIRHGLEHREILTEAERCGASLIVVGSHGRSAVERLFLGSVSSKVLRQAKVPALVVRGSGGPPSKMLAAVEAGESTELVLHTAERWRKRLGATLQVVHVLDPVPEATVQKLYLGPQMLRYQELRQEESRRSVEQSVEKFFPTEPRPALHFRIGRPHSELCDAARDLQAELLVVGPHEKQGMLDLGDTAMRVAHHCPCTVLVARPLPEPAGSGC